MFDIRKEKQDLVPYKSGIGDGADLLVKKPGGLPDEITFDYDILLTGKETFEVLSYIPVPLKWRIMYEDNMINPGWIQWSPWAWTPTFGYFMQITRDLVLGKDGPTLPSWSPDFCRAVTDVLMDEDDPYSLAPPIFPYLSCMYQSAQAGTNPDMSVADFHAFPWGQSTIIGAPGEWESWIPPHQGFNSYVLKYQHNSDEIDLTPKPDPWYSIVWHSGGPATYKYPIGGDMKDKYANMQYFLSSAIKVWLERDLANDHVGNRSSTVTFSQTTPSDLVNPDQQTLWNPLYQTIHRDYYTCNSSWCPSYLASQNHLICLEGFGPGSSHWRAENGLLYSSLIGSPAVFQFRFKCNFYDIPSGDGVDDREVTVSLKHTPLTELYEFWTITSVVSHKRIAGSGTVSGQAFVHELDKSGTIGLDQARVTEWVFDESILKPAPGVVAEEIVMTVSVDLTGLALRYDLPSQPYMVGSYDGAAGAAAWIREIKVDFTSGSFIVNQEVEFRPKAEETGVRYPALLNPYDTDAINAAGFNWSSDISKREVRAMDVDGALIQNISVPTELEITPTTVSVVPLASPFQAFPDNGFYTSLVNSNRGLQSVNLAPVELDTLIDLWYVDEATQRVVLEIVTPVTAEDGETGVPVSNITIQVPGSPGQDDDVHNFADGETVFGSITDGVWLQFSEALDTIGNPLRGGITLTFRGVSSYAKAIFFTKSWTSPDILHVTNITVEREKIYTSTITLMDVSNNNLLHPTVSPADWKKAEPDASPGDPNYYAPATVKYDAADVAWKLTEALTFEVTEFPGFGREGVIDLQWTAIANNPFINIYLDQLDDGTWKVKAKMNQNIETLWYPRIMSGYFYQFYQEYYLFADLAPIETEVAGRGASKTTALSGARRSDFHRNDIRDHFGHKLNERPSQFAPIIVLDGYDYDGDDSPVGKIVGTNPPVSFFDSGAIVGHIPNQPAKAVCARDDKFYSLGYNSGTQLVVAQMDVVDVNAGIVDEGVRTAVETFRQIQTDFAYELFYRNPDPPDPWANPLIIFDTSAFSWNVIVHYLYVDGGILYVAVKLTDTQDINIYHYNIESIVSSGLPRTFDRDDPHVTMGAWFSDDLIYGMMVRDGGIFVADNKDGANGRPRSIVLITPDGEPDGVLEVKFPDDPTAVDKLRGFDYFGDLIVATCFIRGGWRLCQIYVDGFIVCDEPYPSAEATTPAALDADPLYLSIMRNYVVTRNATQRKGVQYTKLDPAPPVLRKVNQQVSPLEGYHDRAGISRVQEFTRNPEHLYPLDYDNVVIEEVELDGISIMNINTYHDEEKNGLMGPFYTVDPSGEISLDPQKITDFDFYYRWIFDMQEAKNRIKEKLPPSPATIDMNVFFADMNREWAGTNESIQHELRVGSLFQSGSRIYLETPETVERVVIKYFIKKAFSSYTIASQIYPEDPDFGLELMSFISIGDEGMYRIYYDVGIDPYHHLSPDQIVDPAAYINDLVSFNPTLLVDNTGFLYADEFDRKANSIDVQVRPTLVTLKPSGQNEAGFHRVYWYAIVRDEYGNPVPNRVVSIRVVLEVDNGGVAEVDDDADATVYFNGGEKTNIMGKVSGFLVIPDASKGKDVLTTQPALFVVETYPEGIASNPVEGTDIIQMVRR